MGARIMRASLPALLLLASAVAAQDARPRLVVQRGHTGTVAAVAVSPDGSRILTGGSDSCACLWDASTARELRRLVGHLDAVTSVAIAPDGRTALTGSRDGSARVWDLGTGSEILRCVAMTGVMSVAFTPDGASFVTGSEGGPVSLWSVASGKEVRRFQHDTAVDAIAVSRDGTRLVAGDWRGTAHVWDLSTGEEIRRIKAGDRWVQAVAFDGSGLHLATAAEENIVRLWDLGSGREVRRFEGHLDSISSLAVSPDGKRLLTASDDCVRIPGGPTIAGRDTIRIWDLDSGREIRRLGPSGVSCAVFTPDGRHIVSGSISSRAVIWDAETGGKLQTLEGAARDVGGASFSADGRLLLLAGEYTAARIWDLARGCETRRIESPEDDESRATVLSADARFVVTGGERGIARLWDVKSGKEVRSFQGHTEKIIAADLTPDGAWLATAGMDGTLRLWNVATGKQSSVLVEADEIDTITIARGGKLLFARAWYESEEAQFLEMWDLTSRTRLSRWNLEETGPPLAISPDGRKFVTSGPEDAESLQLWETRSGDLLGRLGRPGVSAFAADGRLLATVAADRQVRVVDVSTGERRASLPGPPCAVLSLAFSPDGRWLAACGIDGVVYLLEPGESRECCRIFSFEDGRWAVVDPEGRYDASAGGDIPDLHGVIGDNPVSLDQLKERSYEPGLLGKLLGLNPAPLH